MCRNYDFYYMKDEQEDSIEIRLYTLIDLFMNNTWGLDACDNCSKSFKLMVIGGLKAGNHAFGETKQTGYL